MPKTDRLYYLTSLFLTFAYVLLIIVGVVKPDSKFMSPIAPSQFASNSSEKVKQAQEIFGFAPYWNLDKLDNIDFNLLTTLAYDEGKTELWKKLKEHFAAKIVKDFNLEVRINGNI